MKKILIAGATGYLGHFVTQAFKMNNYYTKVLVRNPEKFRKEKINADEVISAEITQPETLVNVCNDVDTVFSSVGITRQKEGFTYMDVDFQGNKNLLEEAVKSKVKKFIYVSVLNGDRFKTLKICAAKEKFVEVLKKSGLDHTVIRPNGYFSDMGEYLNMAKRGSVYIIGNGENRINPISGEDLASFCVENIDTDEKEINVGGPHVFNHNEIAALAFSVCNKPPVIRHIPYWLVKCSLGIMRTFTSVKVYGPFEFAATILSNDMIAPAYGNHKLRDYFESIRYSIESETEK